jgi:hypothetical protein
LLVAGYSAHNVFASGSGVDVCLDHHGGAPHNNLWTDIDLVSTAATTTQLRACTINVHNQRVGSFISLVCGCSIDLVSAVTMK